MAYTALDSSPPEVPLSTLRDLANSRTSHGSRPSTASSENSNDLAIDATFFSSSNDVATAALLHSSQGGDVDAYASTFTPTKEFKAAIASLMIISLMAALDATSLSVALPGITISLHGTAVEGFWSGTSFLLTCTVFQPIFGNFSDIFGRKPCVIASLMFFGVGAVLAAIAKDSMFLILVGRSLQGIGGGGVLVLTEVIVTDLVPLRFRGNYFSLFASMWAIGSVTGPVFGGLLAEQVSWRWIFWVNIPFIAVGITTIMLYLRLQFRPTSLAHKLRRIDWVGVVLFTTSTTGFLIPITTGGVTYAWSSWNTLIPLTISSIGIVAFIVWEDRFASEPLIRTRVMKNRTAAIAYMGDFIQGMVLWCNLYYMPLYFQACKGASPVHSGVDLLPTTFTVAPVAIITGLLITKTNRYRKFIWLGWTLTTLGMALRTIFKVDTPAFHWIPINMIGGLGTGMLYPSIATAMQAATPNVDQAYGVSLFTFFRAAGQCFGVAVGGTVFQNSIKYQISTHANIAEHAEEWAREATVLVEMMRFMPDNADKLALGQSFAGALRVVWIVSMCLSALALVVSLGTEHFDLDREFKSEQGFNNKGVVSKDREMGG